MLSPAWAVLISGRGSNLASLLQFQDEIGIQLVLSSNPEATGLWRAKRAGVRTGVTPCFQGTKKIDWTALTTLLRSRSVTHICLAGFMKIVPPEFVAAWRGRIINLHPSLLPAYPGLKSIELAYHDAHDLGASVHEVVEEVDAGALISQRRCLKRAQIPEYSLALAEFLVHVTEQKLLSETVLKISQNGSRKCLK